MTKKKTRNPQDSTLRNTRAAVTRSAQAAARHARLATRLTELTAAVQLLRLRVAALESRMDRAHLSEDA